MEEKQSGTTCLESATAEPSIPPRGALHSKKASLSDEEMFVLSALFIDKPNEELEPQYSDEATSTTKESVLDDEMLFSVPNQFIEEKSATFRRPLVQKSPSKYRFLVGLWQAFEDGVSPQKLSSMKQRTPVQADMQGAIDEERDVDSDEEEGDDASVKSDQEVRADPDGDAASDASWGEDENQEFDAWQVLKDEYAKDHGYDFSPRPKFEETSDSDDELEPNTFQILGTSSEDESAHPHVLSPPLMDSLMNFVPEHVKGQNLWMKYSLVRDGASFDTFKQYARASKHCLLAIETTKGQVFGCYTSQPWITNPSFFGGAPSFVFKMRHSRNTVCHSLLEQAQMEGELDVHFLLQDGQRPQVCTHDMLGVGEGSVRRYDYEGNVEQTEEELESTQGKNYGFAIALSDDLLSGTTSQCSSYKNPCLVDPNSKGETFEVLNMELWTFTPCFTLDSAEKLEMTQFFVSKSIRSRSSNSSQRSGSGFSSRDLNQNQFYRRVGKDDSFEELRERWQFNSATNAAAGSPRGMGASPRFNGS